MGATNTLQRINQLAGEICRKRIQLALHALAPTSREQAQLEIERLERHVIRLIGAMPLPG